MNDYMQALHRRFFKEPELKELKEEIESVRLSLKAGMSRDDREKLLKMIDLCVELQDEISLESFRSGFQLALGIVSELRPYCFDEDEEERAYQVVFDVWLYVLSSDCGKSRSSMFFILSRLFFQLCTANVFIGFLPHCLEITFSCLCCA